MILYYKLESEATIEISIYDNSGRHIKTFDAVGTQGINKVTFDASGYPAGVYYYNLQIEGSISDSKKMTVLK